MEKVSPDGCGYLIEVICGLLHSKLVGRWISTSLNFIRLHPCVVQPTIHSRLLSLAL
jgi:hypothetical protein